VDRSLNKLVAIGALACASLSFACAGGAAAQSAAPSPAPTAATPAPSPAPSPTPFKLIGLSGFADAGFTAVGLTDRVRFANGLPSRVFDGASGPFFDANGGRQLTGPSDFSQTLDLQNANLQLQLNGSVLSAKFEGSFGSDADVIASNGQSRSGSNLTQAYVQIVQGAVTILAGKFSSLAGAEVIESPNDSNFSRSYLFGDAVPFTHTGVRATYAVNPKISLVAGVNNGWDDWKFAGKRKTLEGSVVLNPSPGYSLSLDTYNGNDFAVNGNSSASALPVLTNRILYDGVLTVHPTGALTLIANYDNGTQLADAAGAFPTAHWNGVAGYAVYQFNSRYGLALRKETFGDDQGFRTGTAQRLQSSTATLNLTPGSNYIFRFEYRLDASNVPAFAYRGYDPLTNLGRDHQSSIGLESIVKFP
jgi:hypothetical protein